MGLTDKIGIAILCAFVLFSVVRLFAAPLKIAGADGTPVRAVLLERSL